MRDLVVAIIEVGMYTALYFTLITLKINRFGNIASPDGASYVKNKSQNTSRQVKKYILYNFQIDITYSV